MHRAVTGDMLAAVELTARVLPFPAGGRRMGKSVNLQACETDWSEAIAAVASTRDREAFARLFDHFAPRVKSYMLRLSAKDAEAEELAQEVMLLVWRKAELFDATSHGAAAWIFTIARNVRIDAARRAKRGGIKEVEDVEAEFRVDGGALADETLMTSEQQAQLRAALSELPTDQRKVVELSFFEERAHGEISALLGLPLGTVKSRLRLAMERLRKRLGSVA